MINKRLMKEAKIKKIYIPVSIISSAFNSIFIIFNALLLALIVNDVFIKHQPVEKIKIYLLLFLVNALVKALFNYFIEGLIRKSSEEIKENIKENIFKNIILASPYKIKEQKLGDLLNLLTDGTEVLIAYYSQYIPQFFSAVIIPISIGILVAFVDKLSAFIMLITYPIIPIFMILIGFKSKEANERQWKRLNILSSHLIDLLQGLRTLKVFGKSKLQEERIFSISEEHRKSTMEVLKTSFLSALVLEITATISTALVAVDLGLRLIYYKIDFLPAFFILVITPDFYIPLRQLGLKFHASLNGQVAIEKIQELEKNLNLEEDVSEVHTLKNSILESESFGDTGTAENFISKQTLEEKEEKVININNSNFEIEVNNLNFSYENKETLQHISFRISPKEKVALVGASGSGKSTLVNILSGFLPVKNNTVFFKGVDINNINRDELIDKIAIVPQFPHIFNMTIRENILLQNEAISDEKFDYVCKITKIDEFAKKFKNGFNTLIGEGEEAAISGGEKQRIAIARALIKDVEFVIFDEPTSALDAETEELFADIINSYFRDKTLIISAHRLNTIKASDKIIVLNGGELVESGKHEKLKNKKGFYYNMISTITEQY